MAVLDLEEMLKVEDCYTVTASQLWLAVTGGKQRKEAGSEEVAGPGPPLPPKTVSSGEGRHQTSPSCAGPPGNTLSHNTILQINK